ncbi:glycosyltransferase [Ruminiclostridium papyrosolvens]|uniref:Erythromycin biosynthesis protein CIII-like C-terminal domain-containing protein n=1 Tax=Ruminiclostridium papyrosolvens C7 TaxID=1330534 RepID=U4R1X3_9FIRM|nr:nucleotide disphospho-sugar-binding domain-containing protein [Ruminiclostridium papyrosolvens]EPR12225.1 hypothetical protein L323_09255 [Ruminiclostridium papyrosolvens C7]
MKRVLVASAAYNWAETHRMAAIGKVFSKKGYEVYSIGKGCYEHLLQENMIHLKMKADDMWYSEDRIHKLMHMDDYGNDYCTEAELKTIVSEEIELLQRINPDIVITGYRTTMSLSCKYTKIPIVWVLSAVVSPIYFKLGLASMPERTPLDYVKNIKDKKTQSRYYSTLALKNNGTSKVWNKVAQEYGLKTFKSDLDIFNGDFNLMSDIAELFQDFKDLPENYSFCGPLFNYEKIYLPESVTNYNDVGRKKIFVSMGSSGEKKIFLKLLELLKDIDADIFVSTTSILAEEETVVFPDNFYFAKAFPHKEMAERVNLSIIHGGQGTVYTTILAGKPFIGIPMFSEQQYNLENIEKFGSCIHLRVSDLNAENFKKSIDKIISANSYIDNAKKLKELVVPYYEDENRNASVIAASKIVEYFNEG